MLKYTRWIACRAPMLSSPPLRMWCTGSVACDRCQHFPSFPGSHQHSRSFDPAAPQGAEVPDPYYGADDGFAEVLGMVRAAMPGLLAWVRDELGELAG